VSSNENASCTPSKFILTDAPPSPDKLCSAVLASPARTLLKAKSPLAQKKRDVLGSRKGGLASSPTAKSSITKTLKRRSAPFTRVDPPAARNGHSSIDAALSSFSKAKAPLQEIQLPTAVKATWQFEIHEDTLEDTLTNIMEFSTGVLDISDDESKVREKDERGKENIPPALDESSSSPVAEAQPSTPVAAEEAPVKSSGPLRTKTKHARKARNTSPFSSSYRPALGEMDPAEFYGEDLNASSFVLVTSPSASTGAPKSLLSQEFQAPSFATPARPRINPFAALKDERKDFCAQQAEKEAASWPSASSAPTFSGFGDKSGSLSRKVGLEEPEVVMIWESGSAKDESEVLETETVDVLADEAEVKIASSRSSGIFQMENSDPENAVSAVQLKSTC
jgi:hypothetical protein